MISRDFLKELQDINELPDKGSVLDLGCGNGRFSIPFNEYGFNCVLVDADRFMLSQAIGNLERHCEAHHDDLVAYLESNAEKHDIIIANNVLPFLSNPKQALELIYKRLKPGGIFIGVFFGERDPWNGSDRMVFHSREQALEALSQYKLLDFREMDSRLGMLSGKVKDWHRFEFIAKKK